MTTKVERTTPEDIPLTPQPTTRFIRRYGQQIGIIGIFVVMMIFLAVAAPRTFQHIEIYQSLAQAVPYYGIMALPITLLVIAQEIDLSFGSVMALSVMSF